MTEELTAGGSPQIRTMRVIPVAGRDSMLLNLSGAHAPYFTRNLVILTDSAGHTVVSKLNEDMCKEITAAGQGAYVRATNANSGLNIVMDQIGKVQRKTYDSKTFKDFEDRFQFFLGFAFLLLIVEFFISNRKSLRLSGLKLFEVKNT